MSDFIDLEIHIVGEDKDAPYYSVSAVTPRGTDVQPITHSKAKVSFTDLLTRSDDDEIYGKELWQILFQDRDVKNAFDKALRTAQSRRPTVPLRLRLCFGANTEPLQTLPWTLLRDPEIGALLATRQDVLLSLYLHSESPLRQCPNAPEKIELKALAVIAMPARYGDFDGQDEMGGQESVDLQRRKIRSSLEDFVTVTWLCRGGDDRPTLENLRRHLDEGYDVLFLACHGRGPESNQGARVFLETDDTTAGPEPVEVAALTEKIGALGVRMPRLVVLASCESAGTHSGRSRLADAFGPMLSQAGVPAVLAMRGKVEMATVDQFMPRFFEDLLSDNGGDIDRAVAAGREAIQRSSEQCIPMLFLRARDGRLWAALDENAVAFRAYRRALQEYCHQLTYIGLPESLHRVYVPLQLQLKHRSAPKTANAPFPGQDTPPESFTGPIEKVLSKELGRETGGAILVFGEPGSGKSNLLRYVARAEMERFEGNPDAGRPVRYLPLPIRLRVLARGKSSALDARLLEVLGDVENGLVFPSLPANKEFYGKWPKLMKARWLLLLDGLDEIPEADRNETLRWLATSLNYHRDQGHSAVLTSRPMPTLPGKLRQAVQTEYEVLPFDPDQQKVFAVEWFGKEKAGQFLDQLDALDVVPMAGTPLLLAIAASMFDPDKPPECRRCPLYEKFVSTWVEEAKERGIKVQLDQDFTALVEDALMHLALTMTEQPEQPRTDEFLTSACGTFFEKCRQLEPPRIPGKATEQQISSFRDLLGQHSGLLCRQDGSWKWLHPTFREYLTACAIVEKGEDENALFGIVWDKAVSRWCQPEWTQVALFALDILDARQVDTTILLRLLRRIHDPNPVQRFRQWWEWWRLRVRRHSKLGGEAVSNSPMRPTSSLRLHFVALALASLSNTNNELLGRVITDLEKEALGYEWTTTSFRPPAIEALWWLRKRADISASLCKIGEDRAASPAVRLCAGAYLALLHMSPDPASLQRAQAIDIFRQVVEQDQEHTDEVRDEAVGCLQQLEAVDVLRELAENPEVHAKARIASAEALAGLGQVPEAASVLRSIVLSPTLDEALDMSRSESKSELRDMLHRVSEPGAGLLNEHCRLAAEKLGTLPGFRDDAVQIVRERWLESDSGLSFSSYRAKAAGILGRLGEVDEAKKILLHEIEIASKDSDEDAACEALATFGAFDELVTIMRNASGPPAVRASAARVLGLVRDDEEDLRTLRDLAQDEKLSIRVRVVAARGLADLGALREAQSICDELERIIVRKPAQKGTGDPPIDEGFELLEEVSIFGLKLKIATRSSEMERGKQRAELKLY